jgi:hypothetical protein
LRGKSGIFGQNRAGLERRGTSSNCSVVKEQSAAPARLPPVSPVALRRNDDKCAARRCGSARTRKTFYFRAFARCAKIVTKAQRLRRFMDVIDGRRAPAALYGRDRRR